MKNIILIHFGARRRYMLAEFLESEGMLCRLITDYCDKSKLHSFLSKFTGLNVTKSRKLPLVVSKEKVISFGFLTFIHKCFPQNKCFQTFYYQYFLSFFVCVRYLFENIKDKTILSMYCENYLFLKFAKWKGAKIVIDIYISPLSNEKLDGSISRRDIDLVSHENILKTFMLADVLLCPSEFVKNDLINFLDGKVKPIIEVIPYGSSLSLENENFEVINDKDSNNLNVIWIGGSCHRKGLDFFYKVAELLTNENSIKFKVIGLAITDIPFHIQLPNIDVIGKVSKVQICNIYADNCVLLFPTLSEGLAAVAIESLSFGCPLFITKAAGVDMLQSDKHGYLIDTWSPECVAKKIIELNNDKDKFSFLSRNSLTLSSFYSKNSYKKRFINFLNSQN